MVVVGGGPTGVEYAAELQDYLVDDLKKWYPEIADRLKITLVEALPNVLPMFSKKLIEYTESTFKDNQINLLTKTMVKDVQEKHITVQDADKVIKDIPYGLLVWATGNTSRGITRNLMSKLPETQTNRRGLAVDDGTFELLGAEGIFAVGDNAATKYAPTAQVAAQQGAYLAKAFKGFSKRDAAVAQLAALKADPTATPDAVDAAAKAVARASKVRPFSYSHQGSLAYVGSEKAIADLPIFGADNLSSFGGATTYWFWRSAYLSNLYSLVRPSASLGPSSRAAVLTRPALLPSATTAQPHSCRH